MKQKLNENQESATVQSAKQNVQDEPTAESGFTKPADAAFENPAGGGSAPSSCSAGTGVSDKQFDWENAIKNIATDSSKQTVDPLSVGLAQPMPPQLVTDDHILSVEGSRYVPSPQ